MLPTGTLGQKLLINLGILATTWVYLAVSTPRFLSIQNLSDVFDQVAHVGIVATFVTLLMVSLNFDLSVGGVLALSGCVSAILASDGWPLPIAFAAGVAVGGVVGIANGMLVLVVGINSVIATLGMMYLTRGAALLSTHGVSLYVADPAYKWLGIGRFEGLPVDVLVMAAIVLIGQLIAQRTLVGKYARAVGSNTQSARLAGVPTTTVRFALFILAGLGAGIAGVLVSSRDAGGYPDVGVGFELQVIVAAVLGGTRLAGGEGSVVGTFIGSLVVGTLNNGLDLLQIPTFWQTVALGTVLLVALGIDAALNATRSVLRGRGARATGAHSFDGLVSSVAHSSDRGNSKGSATATLSITGLSKSFGGVHALTDASFEVRAGEVHALLGENGAGKSTLVKIIAGALKRDAGEFRWHGEPITISSFQEAEKLGIRVIYQHPNILDHLTVAENITLGREKSTLTVLDLGEQRNRAKQSLAILGVDLPPDEAAGGLRVAEKQIVEIARALWGDVRLLIMDEPTASLGDREVERLFTITRRLTERGVAVVFISHKLDEVFLIADRVTVLRNGQTIGTVNARDATPEDLVAMMVGRRIGHVAQRTSRASDRVVLQVESLSTDTGLAGISFSLRQGEVLGVYGLLGSGRTELARALFGADPIRTGAISIGGRPIRIQSPADAKRRGLGLVPEERSQALFSFLSVRENISAASLDMVAPRGWLRRGRERHLTRNIVEALKIRTPTIENAVSSLSGGNQQKVVVGRWLLRDIPILVMDDPTSGVDVGAKDDLYRLIDQMTARQTSILLTSSELPELLALSDRVMVLHRGKLAGILGRDEMTRERVIHMAVGRSELSEPAQSRPAFVAEGQ